jgi:DTW domain-containing protein
METRTHFLFLLSPKEFKEEKSGTGRLTQISLANSTLHMARGKGFDDDAVVQAVLDDPRNYCVLLYPGATATNLSEPLQVPIFKAALGMRRLVVILLDATWSGARKMLFHSPSLQRLPRLMFNPSAPSRFIIKQQPQEGCLSTLEATHELLLVLAQTGLDHYERPEQLLAVFERMQDFQLKCAADLTRPGYRRRAYTDPATRRPAGGDRPARRDNFIPRTLGPFPV